MEKGLDRTEGLWLVEAARGALGKTDEPTQVEAPGRSLAAWMDAG